MLVEEKILMVAPNQCTKFIHIEAEKLVRNVVLCDRTGAIIKVETINKKSADINIAYLASGRYIVKIQNYDGEWSAKRFTKN